MKRRLLLPAALVAAAAVAAAASRRAAPTARPSVAVAAPSVDRAPAPEAPPARDDPAPRETSAATVRYAVSLTSRIDLDARASSQHDELELTLRGGLEATVIARSPQGSTLALRLDAPELHASQSGRDALTPTTRDLLARQLGVTVYVDRDARGRVGSVRVPPGVDGMASGVLRYLVSATQVTRPEDPGLRRWSAREVDVTAPCTADYSLGDHGAVARLRRDWTPARANAPRVDGAARALFALARDGEIERLDDSVTLRTEAGDGVWARSTSQLTLRRTSGSLAALAPDALRAHLARWRSLSPCSLDAVDDDPATRAAADRRLVAGATLSSLRASLRAGEDGAAAEAQQRMVALFRLSPSEVDAAGRALRDAPAHEAAVLAAALSQHGSPEAQSALARVATDDGAEASTRVQALTGLGLTEHPTRDTVDALARSTRSPDASVRSSARLGLGAAGYAARQTESPWAPSAFDALSAQLAATEDPEAQVDLLDALGNTGDPRLVGLATRWLGRDAPPVREAAVAAVRLVGTPEGDEFVSAQLTQRDDVAARAGAVRAAGFRALEPLAAGLESLLRDPERAVRARAVSMLGGRLRDAALAGELLLRFAEGDPDTEVRDAARSWLRQLDGAGSS